MWRMGVVNAVEAGWPGVSVGTVRLEVPLPSGGTQVRALSYESLTGGLAIGDRVVVNATAVARGLGTGGYAFVVATPDRLPPDPIAGPGHVVKARYTPVQTMVLGVDEQESPEHQAFIAADSVNGMPVVVADLHSSLPAIIAGARHAAELDGRGAPRVVYVMTDGAALPLAFSRSVATLRSAGWLDATVTVGQAFGGDAEATSLHTGLIAAKATFDADIAIVAQGPGNLGTGTMWGFSGVAAGEAINAAAVLGGRPVASLRVSGADQRERHCGISHHSLTAYGRVALASADVVVPVLADSDEPAPGLADLFGLVSAQAQALCAPTGRHRRRDVPVGGAVMDTLTESPVPLSTMGRGLDADPAAFLAAASAGMWAASLSEAN